MNAEINNMIINKIIKQANQVMFPYGFWLHAPREKQMSYEEGEIWLMDMYGVVILRNIDVFKYTEGFDLLNEDVTFGFNDCVANLCDILLIMAGVKLDTEDEDMAYITDPEGPCLTRRLDADQKGIGINGNKKTEKENIMKNTISEPIYTFEPIVTISLFNDSVPKAYHDFVWEQATRHIAKMGKASDVTVGDILDVGVYVYISKEGMIAAEKCLEHWATMGYLPIALIDREEDGSAYFTVI